MINEIVTTSTKSPLTLFSRLPSHPFSYLATSLPPWMAGVKRLAPYFIPPKGNNEGAISDHQGPTTATLWTQEFARKGENYPKLLDLIYWPVLALSMSEFNVPNILNIFRVS
ncbi:hypothetical protein ElyMa_004775900 [Elysia marginata]|uniref:Uncharacterized protein n=1 Tax=Elysia marginata TaxID=1093978 RepID=A0AAV4IK99_9GAST|nr:hypothetical protein ElyMa_004775900 [Elysia marginata]